MIRFLGYAALVVLAAIVGVAMWLFAVPVAFIALGHLLPPMPHACYTEILGRQTGLGGYDFEISDTSCKTLASDEAVTIFVTRHGESKKTALFKYDPGKPEIPVITLTDPHTVTIAVRHVGEIVFRKSGWADMSIRYELGTVDYPEKFPDWISRRRAYLLCLISRNRSTPDWDECSPYANDDYLYRPPS